MDKELRELVIRVVFALIALAIGLLSVTQTPVFTLSRDFAIALIVGGLAVGGVNVVYGVTNARAAGRMRATLEARPPLTNGPRGIDADVEPPRSASDRQHDSERPDLR